MKTDFKQTILALLACAACQAVRAEPPDPPAISNAPEPITGEPAKPNPGDETETKDPFEPYSIGPPEEAVSRDQLSPEEQAVADGSRNSDAATLEKYRQAVLQNSARVTAEIAARQLGVDNLKTVGVAP